MWDHNNKQNSNNTNNNNNRLKIGKFKSNYGTSNALYTKKNFSQFSNNLQNNNLNLIPPNKKIQTTPPPPLHPPQHLSLKHKIIKSHIGPFIPYMTLDECKKLKIGDQIDHRFVFFFFFIFVFFILLIVFQLYLWCFVIFL